MKKRLLCLALILTVGLAVSACGAPPDAIQWQEPALEALVREKLDKPKGAITPSDLEHIWGIELFGESHIFFNAEGGYEMYTSSDDASYLNLNMMMNPDNIDLKMRDNDRHLFKDGTYSVDGQQYTRGFISSLADFANFSNLKYLHIYKNNLADLSGLASLEHLTDLKLVDNNIQDIAALAELRPINSLDLIGNYVEDISPLSNLDQLSWLSLGFNHISNVECLANMNNLTRLSLGSNPITSLAALEGLTQLRNLWFSDTAVNDVSFLTGMTSLAGLSMDNLDAESIDLTPLSNLENLRFLFIQYNRGELLNIQALGQLKNLWGLDIKQSENVSDEDIALLKKQLPECFIQ